MISLLVITLFAGLQSLTPTVGVRFYPIKKALGWYVIYHDHDPRKKTTTDSASFESLNAIERGIPASQFARRKVHYNLMREAKKFISTKPKVTEECQKPPIVIKSPQDCCRTPTIFKEEDFIACGVDTRFPSMNTPWYECTAHVCLLDKNRMLTAESRVDMNKVERLIDAYAQKYPRYKNALAVAKEICLSRKVLGTPLLCEASKLIQCIQTTLFNECPQWIETKPCKTLINHMILCRKYYE